MLFSATKEQIINEVSHFANEEIRPFAKTFDEQGELPDELIQKMATNRYLCASLPTEYGGLGLDPITFGLFTQEIGKACCNTRTLVTVQAMVGESLVRFGTIEQKEFWLPCLAKGEKLIAFALTEPFIGSDAKNVETSYVKQGDNYILNGRKKWISFGDRADIFLVIANHKGTSSAFLVERDMLGFSTTRMKGLLASRASYLAEIELSNVEVPSKNLLGKEGTGFTYVVSNALDHGRYSIAWAAVAVAQEAVDLMVTYARGRKQGGRHIYSYQLVQGIIADAVTNIHAARALCLKAGEMRIEKHPDAIIETNIAKYFSSKVAMKVATDCMQILGGNAFSNDYAAERLFREAKVFEVIEGTSQLQQEIIANYGLRAYYKKNSHIKK